jgi:hypothetical protein
MEVVTVNLTKYTLLWGESKHSGALREIGKK